MCCVEVVESSIISVARPDIFGRCSCDGLLLPYSRLTDVLKPCELRNAAFHRCLLFSAPLRSSYGHDTNCRRQWNGKGQMLSNLAQLRSQLLDPRTRNQSSRRNPTIRSPKQQCQMMGVRAIMSCGQWPRYAKYVLHVWPIFTYRSSGVPVHTQQAAIPTPTLSTRAERRLRAACASKAQRPRVPVCARSLLRLGRACL